MENQLKEALISLHKISNYTAKTRIDTTQGDADEFVSTPTATVYRSLFDSRLRAREMLMCKYAKVRELVVFIIESGKFLHYLPLLKLRLEKTVEGLLLYKSNPRYIHDKKIKSTIEHLLEEEIPGQLEVIDAQLCKAACAPVILKIDNAAV